MWVVIILIICVTTCQRLKEDVIKKLLDYFSHSFASALLRFWFHLLKLIIYFYLFINYLHLFPLRNMEEFPQWTNHYITWQFFLFLGLFISLNKQCETIRFTQKLGIYITISNTEIQSIFAIFLQIWKFSYAGYSYF